MYAGARQRHLELIVQIIKVPACPFGDQSPGPNEKGYRTPPTPFIRFQFKGAPSISPAQPVPMGTGDRAPWMFTKTFQTLLRSGKERQEMGESSALLNYIFDSQREWLKMVVFMFRVFRTVAQIFLI